jgi:diguanylate cyclase (GGDEF)-like protein/PAS domain S-box-containing protein
VAPPDPPTSPDEARPVAFEHLQDLVRRLGTGLDLATTLEAVTQAVVDVLDFQVAVVSLVAEDGALESVAVAGSDEARSALVGNRASRAAWDEHIASAQPWGGLCFVDHEVPVTDEIRSWVPDVEVVDHPDAWHPDDELFAPLWSRDRSLLGILGVDLPRHGRRPGPVQRAMLELFALQAAAAIENARLHADALQRERASAALLARLETLVDSAPVAIVEFDAGGKVTLWNPVAERMFGWRADEVLGRDNPTLPPQGTAELSLLQTRLRSGEAVQRFETVRLCKDGSSIPVEITTGVLRRDDGRPDGGVAVLVDVTERRLLEARLRHAAFHDPLTGLPNRALFDDRLRAAFDRVRRGGGRLALLTLDLDGFKQVNDALGHAVGDELLVTVAQRLRDQLRDVDTVARLGGDEFVVLVEADAEGLAEGLADRLVDAIGAPVMTSAGEQSISVSIGIARTGPLTTTPEQLLHASDLAMYAAKAGPVPSQPSGS